jgi:PAS domain-containing protein
MGICRNGNSRLNRRNHLANGFRRSPEKKLAYWSDLNEWVRGLSALVLLFDVYTIYQHFQLQRVRRELLKQDELFQVISENAADMIAVVDADGRSLYSSPAYDKDIRVFSSGSKQRFFTRTSSSCRP